MSEILLSYTVKLEDPIQNTESNFCGINQQYFGENLFNPIENRKIINLNNLRKTTVQKLLNELFSLDKD